ncbi:MAG: hypothetical protein M1608_02480, partial [Candidatus Omnitrophica bacterium]|nr:hypothetical protein [Candidatus Omnitrophota bacterium]
DYNQDPVSGDSMEKAIELFRVFVGFMPRNPQKYPPQQMQQELGNSLVHQAPFSPVRKIYQNISWQVNDPLVHYTWQDLYDYERTNTIQFAVPPQSPPTNSNLGLINRRYRPWGGNPNISYSSDTNAFNLALKDPLVRGSDDWDFPTNKLPNIGWLGRIHRGTPWQTIYLKSASVETNAWLRWAVNPFSVPTNDWRLLDLFTVAQNDNAARGLLSVNQTNLAAWSAVLSGVSVVSNTVSGTRQSADFTDMEIQPDSPQLHWIVDSINQTRATLPGQGFHYLGEVLASPGLTVSSPFLPTFQTARDIDVNDEVYERIPQQILSLLQADNPRIVVYAYGQSLAPAEHSLVIAPGQPFDRLCTNYQI